MQFRLNLALASIYKKKKDDFSIPLLERKVTEKYFMIGKKLLYFLRKGKFYYFLLGEKRTLRGQCHKSHEL